MANENNVPTAPEAQPTSREKLLSRARDWYPDRDFDSNENALADSIEEKISDLIAGQEENDAMQKRLVDLLESDPRSANVFMSWLETGDPISAMVEEFGDDLGIDEEHAAGFEKQLQDWRTRKQENDTLQQEAQANWDKSLANLEEWGNAKGLSLEQKRDVMLRLLAIAFNGMENKYNTDDFDLALNAINHDADVATARQEGEIAGRNERIAASRRERTAAASLPPSAQGGQGSRVRERGTEDEGSIWDDIR